MKKKLLFCLATLGAASMLFGFDSAETADSILEKVQTATTSSEGATATISMNFNGSMDTTSGETTSSLGMALGGDLAMAMNMNPLAMSMQGAIKIELLGQSQETPVQMYMVPEDDGTMSTYVYTEVDGEGSWEHQTSEVGSLDMASLAEASSSIDYSEWGIVFDLAPEAVDVDGTECYLLSTVINMDTVKEILAKAEETTGQSVSDDPNVQLVFDVLDGLSLKVEYYVATATYLPVKAHLDLNDSDLSAASAYITSQLGEAAEGSSIDLVLNDASFDMTIAYGAANDITVPDEAIAAAAAGSEGLAPLEEAGSEELASLEEAAEEAVE